MDITTVKEGEEFLIPANGLLTLYTEKAADTVNHPLTGRGQRITAVWCYFSNQRSKPIKSSLSLMKKERRTKNEWSPVGLDFTCHPYCSDQSALCFWGTRAQYLACLTHERHPLPPPVSVGTKTHQRKGLQRTMKGVGRHT